MTDAALRLSDEPEPPHILVADDCAHMRQTLSALLEAWDLAPRFAENGADAFEQVVNDMPSLLITDLQMPVEDGYDLLRKVKSLPEAQQPPVIVLSGSLHEINQEKRTLLKQANYLLLKPVDPHCLFDCVSRLLEDV